MRVLAVTELKKHTLAPMEKVNLGSQNNVMSLFVEGCASFASARYNSEQLQDLATDFGWDFAARIMWVVSSAGNKIDRMVGIPKGDMKCQRCAATLVIVESTCDPVRRRSGSGPMAPPPPPPPHPSLPQTAPHHQPQPGPVGQPPTFPNQPQSQMQMQALMRQQQMQRQQYLQQHSQQAKRSLSLKFSCTTPTCTGPAAVKEIRLGALGAIAGGLLGLIEGAFSEKMKEMY